MKGGFTKLFGQVPRVAIIEALAQNSEFDLTATEIREISGVSKRATYLILQRLLREGLLIEKKSRPKLFSLNLNDVRARTLSILEPILELGDIESLMKDELEIAQSSSIAIDEIKHNGVKSGILTYIRCITRSMKVLYNPDTYIPLMSVLPFVKKGEKKLSPKKQFKLDRKKQKKEFREGQKKQKAPSVMVSVKKHISKSAFMGSKLIAGVSVFAGAMAVHDYQTVGITALPTIYYGVGSLGGALISSAPYARSVSRTNKALSQADAKLVQMDQLVGENQQLVKSAIATFETHMANNQSVQPASIEQLKQKVEQHEAHIAQVREKLNISNPVQKDADVHVAPASSGSGNHNAD